MSEPALADKVVSLHAALRLAGVPHAFGGALALAYYAEPRATIDIDVNLFVPATERERVTVVLARLDVELDSSAAAALRDGQERVWWGRTPIDLFYAYDAIHRAMGRAAREVPFGDETIPVLSPEHLAVCKVVFDRPKDWIDIEQMLSMTRMRVPAMTRWLVRLVGQDDPRLVRLSGLVARARGRG